MAYFQDPTKKPKPGEFGASPMDDGAPSADVGLHGQDAPTKAGGGGFVNLQTYLGLNQNQGKDMANTLAGGVQQRGVDVQADIRGAQNGFQRGINDTVGAFNRGQGNGQLTTNSIADTNGFGQLSQDASKTSQDANALTGFGTRQDLVNQTFGKDAPAQGYSGGMGRYDNVLAGASDGGQFREAANQYGGLDKALGLAVDESGQKADQYRKDFGQGQADFAASSRKLQEDTAANEAELKAAERRYKELAQAGNATANRNSPQYQQYKDAWDAYTELQKRRATLQSAAAGLRPTVRSSTVTPSQGTGIN